MMMQFLLFQNGEDEPIQSLAFDLPGVPQTGDLVTISRPDQEGCSDFIVRRVQWDLDYPDSKTTHRADKIVIGSARAVTVECTFALGPYSSEEHKRTAPCAPRHGGL